MPIVSDSSSNTSNWRFCSVAVSFHLACCLHPLPKQGFSFSLSLPIHMLLHELGRRYIECCECWSRHLICRSPKSCYNDILGYCCPYYWSSLPTVVCLFFISWCIVKIHAIEKVRIKIFLFEQTLSAVWIRKCSFTG